MALQASLNVSGPYQFATQYITKRSGNLLEVQNRDWMRDLLHAGIGISRIQEYFS